MNNFDSAFKKVCELADDFKKNEQLYLSPKYSEAQVRQDFIDKFHVSGSLADAFYRRTPDTN